MTGLRKLICVLLSAVMLCGNSGIVLADDSTQTALANTGSSGGGSSSGGIIDEDVRAFTYVVDNMAFWQGDAEIEEPDSSCEVSVDMTKRKQSNDRDKLIIAAYSDTDRLIGMYTVVHDIEFGKTSNIKVSVTVPEGDVLGNVKAFVWDSFGGMRALSNTISRYNNREIDPMLEYDEEQQTSFIDVSKDSEYAYAIEFLATLGVLKGNSNGYFNPTGSVNRAAAAAGISHIAGRDEEAYYLRGESIYTDTVPGDIITGYLNLGYIEPVSPGVIAPYDNITTGEFIRAAVKALGYAETAEVLGGWPTGYISAAKSLGLLSGIKSNISDSLTREELAMLCLNTLNAPIMEIVGTDYTASGVVVPKKVKMDGTGANYYKSFLTETYGAYSVEGFVVETANSGTLNQGKVKFGIAKSENYKNTDFSYNSFDNPNAVDNISDVLADSSRIVTVGVGETNAADYEGIYAKAIIRKDENGDYVIIRFFPTENNDNDNDDNNNDDDVVDDNNNTFIVDANLIDKEEYTIESFSSRTENYLYIYESDTATKPSKYNLQQKDDGTLDVAIYVNGIVMDTTTDAKTRSLIDTFVIESSVGDVKFVDTYETDGYYDTIYVNYYVTALVDSVVESSKKIYFKDSTPIGIFSLTLNEEANENIIYNIYYNGEKIDVTDIKKDDILSIAYNVGDGTKTAFTNSDFYDIYVSRTVETGMLTKMSVADEVVTIGGTEYGFVDSYTSATKDFKLGDEYTIYVDYFGRIYKSQMKITPSKYAVVDKFIYNNSDEDYRLTLFTAEGETKTLTFDSSKATVHENGAAVSGVSTKVEKQNYILGKVYINGSSASYGRQNIEDRVVKYKVSASTGRVTEIDFLTASNSTVSSVDVIKANYKAATGAIGSVKDGDATKIIDAIKYCTVEDADYTDLVITTKASLEDGDPYRAYGYGEKVDGYHPFVLICEGPAPYNAKSRFAVIADSITTAIDDSDMYIYKIPAFYYKSGEDNNSVKQLIGNDELNEPKVMALNVGDIIMFRLDANGYIDDFDVIFSLSSDGVPEYDALVAESIVKDNDTAFFTNGVIALPNIDDRSEDWVEEWAGYTYTTEPIQLIYGPVVTKSSNSFGIAKIAEDSDGTLYTNLNNSERYDGGVYEIDIDSSTAVYEYDYSQSKKNRLSIGTAAAIRASSFFESNLVDNDYIPWNLTVAGETPNLESVNFAFALVVDGMAKDVLVFNSK